jgi:hypothetical protein
VKQNNFCHKMPIGGFPYPDRKAAWALFPFTARSLLVISTPQRFSKCFVSVLFITFLVTRRSSLGTEIPLPASDSRY